ncbi:MAG: F0F1 ATP synthase subunit alpha, partial [Sphingobacteriales bacterium]
GTNNLIREVPVKNVKAFEDAFIREMEVKHPDILNEFKKGNLPEDGINRMVKLAQDLIPQFKN